MRNLRRNMTTFEYFAPDGVDSDLNEYGEHTGEFYPVYADPVVCRGNISVPSGRTAQYMFGTDARYTHVLIAENRDEDIREGGKIRWQGDMYDITAVRPSLNTLSVALRKKTEDHSPEMPYVPDPEPDEGPTGATDGDGE